MSWIVLSPGCRTQSDAVNAALQSPRRVITRSLNGAGVAGLGRMTVGHIRPHDDSVCRSASNSTYSTKSTGSDDWRTTSRPRLYKSRMLALSALPALTCDWSLDRLVCCCKTRWLGAASVVSTAVGKRETATESIVTAFTRCDVIVTVRTAGCLNMYDDDEDWKHDNENTGWKRTANWLSATFKQHTEQTSSTCYVTNKNNGKHNISKAHYSETTKINPLSFCKPVMSTECSRLSLSSQWSQHSN